MSDHRLPVILRPMRMGDIDEVVELDRLSFPTPWPARTYRYELTNPDRTTLAVLERPDGLPYPVSRPLVRWLRRLTHQPATTGRLAGYVGMWHIADEAHVSTIAVHPDWRGHKLGELLLWSMIRRAAQRGAHMITLEVRVTNIVAQNLYRKYHFEVMGRRKGYYRDNGEDAYMMGVTNIDADYREQLMSYGRALASVLRVTDRL